MRKTDFWDYIKDHWNQLDIAVILMNIYYFANKYVVQEEKSSEIANTVLDLAVFVLSFLKLMYFLRIFENFGHLIQMLQNCLIDISVFMVFLLSWILVYTLALDILNSSFDDGDYSNLNAFLASLIQMYRNSIGDIAAPLYARWTKLAEEGTPSQQD